MLEHDKLYLNQKYLTNIEDTGVVRLGSSFAGRINSLQPQRKTDVRWFPH
jgi:hypothetical protein